MKKLFTLLLMLSAAFTTQAQVTKAEYDAAWQRQFTLNQGFGTNINTLLTANGDRRRQIEALQRLDTIKTKQIADLTAQIINLTNIVNLFTNRVVAVEKKAPDTFKVAEGFKIIDKTFYPDTAFFNKLYAIKAVEPAIVQLANMYTSIAARTQKVEARLEDIVGRVIIIEAFKAAIKNL